MLQEEKTLQDALSDWFGRLAPFVLKELNTFYKFQNVQILFHCFSQPKKRDFMGPLPRLIDLFF